MAEKKEKFLIVRVPTDMYDNVKRKAKDGGTKVSEWLRRVVERALK